VSEKGYNTMMQFIESLKIS